MGRICKCCLSRNAAAFGNGVPTSQRMSNPVKPLQNMYFSNAIPSSQLSSGLILQLGTALFLVGILGNAYHHYLLSTLRSKAEIEQKKRKVAAHQCCLNCTTAANAQQLLSHCCCCLPEAASCASSGLTLVPRRSRKAVCLVKLAVHIIFLR